jgi:hypothetical protein
MRVVALLSHETVVAVRSLDRLTLQGLAIADQTNCSKVVAPPGIWLIIQACSTSPNCCGWALL